MEDNWRSKVAKKEVQLRKHHTEQVAPLIRGWIKERENDQICPICGEDMPETFHKHHIDGDHSNNSKNNLVNICGSCHVITYKAKTRLKELWTQRHNRFIQK